MLKLSLIRRLSDDHGASAVIVAASILLLLGFAAVAVDATGLGFNERRQNQSAADVGALTAVQFAVTENLGNGCTGSPGSIARCNGAHEAIEVANNSLDDPSLADWSDASKCATPPAGFTASSVSACVAFNSNAQRAWVRIPTIQNPTTLGKVIGFNAVSTSADAIAGSTSEPPAGVLPFLLPGNAAGGNYDCLKSGSNPNWGPCEDNPTTGNFGSADFFLYGDADRGWTAKCSGDTNGRLVANVARGTDHPLSTYGPPAPPGAGSGVEDAPNCPVYSAQPNTVDSQTGVGSYLEDGLLYGASAYSPSPYSGKLWDTSGFRVRNGGGSTPEAWINDKAIWDFLIDDGSLDFTDCDPDPFDPSQPDAAKPPQMDLCMAWAKSTDTVIFTDDLASSPRFGWVPQLWEDDFTGNPYHIELFRPVYLDTTWYKCGSNKCNILHTPGIGDSAPICPVAPVDTRITCGTPGDKNDSLEAVTSWILEAEIVPDNAKTPSPGSANQRTFSLVE